MAKGRPKDTRDKESPEYMKDKLAKLREQEAKLIADLAVKEHPELRAEIESVTNFLQELTKADTALKMGADVNVKKQKEALQKQIDHLTNKIVSLNEALAASDEQAIVKQLEAKRAESLVNAARAFAGASAAFADSGVDVAQLIPNLAVYKDELEGTEIPAEEE